MKVFITGASGFIGSVVARKLAAQGHTLRLLMRATSRADRLHGVAYHRCSGDVSDIEALTRGMRGCDGVLHLASLSSWSDIHSPRMRDVVVEGTRNVLAAAIAAGKPKMVYVSSTLAIGGTETPRVLSERDELPLDDPEYTYSRCKREAENLCRSANMPVVIVNPGEVYGPEDTQLVTAQTLIDFAASGPALVCKGGTMVAHVDDVAEGIIAALRAGRPSERYILGSENLTLRELARLCGAIRGRPKWTVTLPTCLARGLSQATARARLSTRHHPAVIAYATRYWFMDASKARRELGASFRPAREVLASTLAWLAATGRIH